MEIKQIFINSTYFYTVYACLTYPGESQVKAVHLQGQLLMGAGQKNRTQHGQFILGAGGKAQWTVN